MDPATDWVASDGKMALDFNGGDDYISLGDKAIFEPTDFSISLWIKTSASGSFQMLFAKSGNSDTVYQTYLDNTNKLGFNVLQDGTNNNYAAISGVGSSMSDGKWHHVTFTLRDTVRIAIFSNGVEIGSSTTFTGARDIHSSAELQIGSRQYVGSRLPFNGKLDDLIIYNRDVTPSEISTLALRRGIAYETYSVPVVRGASVGGGTFTGTSALTLGGLEFAGSGTTDVPTYEGTASLALGGLEFSGTASVDNPTYEATAALTLGGVEFAGAASATVNTFTATAALNLGRLDFAGSASFTAPEYTATASLSLAGIDFAGSAAFSTALRTATVEVEIGGMQFTGSATFQTPVMEASAALVLGGVEFAGADVVLGDTTIFLYYYQMMGVQE